MRHFACFMKVDDCQAQNAILTIAFLVQLIIFLFFCSLGRAPKVKGRSLRCWNHGFPWVSMGPTQRCQSSGVFVNCWFLMVFNHFNPRCWCTDWPGRRCLQAWMILFWWRPGLLEDPGSSNRVPLCFAGYREGILWKGAESHAACFLWIWKANCWDFQCSGYKFDDL